MSPSRDSAPRRDCRPSSLGRKLAALAGAGGSLVAGTEAEAVIYTPTAGVVAAQGIPGFSFVDATNVTLGNLRGPATAGSTAWDLDGVGGTNFSLVNALSLIGALQFTSDNLVLFSGASSPIRNIATGGAVSAAQNSWQRAGASLTYVGRLRDYAANFTLGTSGQFGFQFTEGTNTYYGWASLLIDGVSTNAGGQGFKITEAYYQSTPGTAINVGAVPVPEPTGMALLAIGSAGVMAWRSRRKQAS